MNNPGWLWYGIAATVAVPYLAGATIAAWMTWKDRRK